MRQKVSKAYENFPTRGGVCQTTIETHVDYQIFLGVVVQRPKISHSIAAQKWLCEVPDFSGESKLSFQRMGDGQCLTELRAAD